MSLEEIKNYLRIDYTEDDDLINELIEIAQIYLDECVGEGYKSNLKGVKLSNLLIKKFVKDMYENRSTSIDNIKKDRITETVLQLFIFL